ncbi:cytochrome P450 monooxygenase pc-bph [Amylocystis lapponica]|nr:cytochrome P450 monooxygenase pc-bph [Amylocystis lapponica]
MTILYEVSQASPTNILFASSGIVLLVIAVHCVIYLADPHGLRTYPGPYFAKFTDVWMCLTASQGGRLEDIHQLHRKFGTFVRLGPKHVSISSPAALNAVYGHSSRTLKSEFYDAFVMFDAALFSTRSRTVHTRKRRIVAHMFAPQGVREFEPAIREHLGELCGKWDKLCEQVDSGKQEGILGTSAWTTEKGYVWFKCTPWLNYFSFDTIGHLAFGQKFGMLHTGKDIMKVAKSLQAGLDACDTSGTHQYETEEVSVIATLSKRADFTLLLAVLPLSWRPILKCLPWVSQGNTAVRQLMGIGVTTVARRLSAAALGNGEMEKRDDMLERLLEGRDEEGKPMGPPELSAEALTLFIAGSDTVATSASAIIYYVSRDARVKEKLQAELDTALDVDAELAHYELVRHLPYLDAVINEGLRLFSTVGGSLPRVVPEGGLTVLGETFKEGTVLSVQAYTVHRDPDVWGVDAEDFRPERWLEGDAKELHKAFSPYSLGPRACVGRNLAQMELLVLMATLFHRYDTVLKPGETLQARDTFVRKLKAFTIGMRRRHL